MLFHGEEWGASTPFQYFTAHEDEELGAQVTEGRRREFVAFGWDGTSIPNPQSQETFERSRLRWEELARAPHLELLKWYRALIALRREHGCLSDGDYQRVEVLFAADGEWLVVRRGYIGVACNLGERPAVLPLENRSVVLLASTPAIQLENDAAHLPPHSVVVVASGAAAAG
jgi:maltooligosyltrehalose trehalohydrolase